MSICKHNAMRSDQNAQGFTLLEVLIAGLILFITLTAGLGAYQMAMGGSHKAAQQLHLLQVAELAQVHIQKALRDQVISASSTQVAPHTVAGRTQVLNVAVDWSAQLIEQGAPPPQFDESTFADVHYEPRFFKYAIDLNLRTGARQHNFSYIELAWFNQLSIKGS